MQICGKVAVSRPSWQFCIPLVWGMALPRSLIITWLCEVPLRDSCGHVDLMRSIFQHLPPVEEDPHFTSPPSFWLPIIWPCLNVCPAGQKHDPEIVYRRLIASFCCHSGRHDVSSDWMSALLMEWWVKIPPLPLKSISLDSYFHSILLEKKSHASIINFVPIFQVVHSYRACRGLWTTQRKRVMERGASRWVNLP